MFKALKDLGLQAATSFRLDGQGRIDVEIADGVGLESAIVQRLPPDLRDAVSLTHVPATDFAELAMRGGVEAWDNNIRQCTTGWAVVANTPWGVFEGVTTAAHCPNIGLTIEPNVVLHFVYENAEYYSTLGDVELLYDDYNDFNMDNIFYATQTETRTVTSLEPIAGISIGESVCHYGRTSNSRTCATVANTSTSCFTSTALIRMNGNAGLQGGDSGGGWSSSNTAYGITKGICSGAVWTAADYLDETLCASGKRA